MRESAGGADPSCSAAGACGAMQLMPGYWHANRCDGDGDGRMEITDVYDNVCASVNGLLHDKHTLIAGRRMTRDEIATMARSYCGSLPRTARAAARSTRLLRGRRPELRTARRHIRRRQSRRNARRDPYASQSGSTACVAQAAEPTGRRVGRLVDRRGANRPGHPLAPLSSRHQPGRPPHHLPSDPHDRDQPQRVHRRRQRLRPRHGHAGDFGSAATASHRRRPTRSVRSQRRRAHSRRIRRRGSRPLTARRGRSPADCATSPSPSAAPASGSRSSGSPRSAAITTATSTSGSGRFMRTAKDTC